MVVLVDSTGAAVGTHAKATVHGATTPRHLAFSCHVLDHSGRVLMTRRALGKQTWPGVWTNSFCGHPEPGEPIESAVHRRAEFELGLRIEILSCPLPDFGYTARDTSGVEENEHCPVFVARALSDPAPNPDEVAETYWTTPSELDAASRAAPRLFSPWLTAHLADLLPHLKDPMAGPPAGKAASGAADTPTAAFDRRFQEVLAAAHERAGRSVPAGARLWEKVDAPALDGKKIRPQLLLGAYEALGGSEDAAAVDAACAVELLHAALVVHDDVIDGDLTRRGHDNVTGRFASEARSLGASRRDARAWGEASAILVGDLLLTRAQSLIARLNVSEDLRRAALDVFDDAVFESAAGEHTDVWLSMHLESATPDDVLAMIEQKTAAYSFRAPLVLAALLARAPQRIVDELGEIARRLGVIYQLRDDVLGTFGDERQTGKPSLGDLREGKETLLISYARSDPSWPAVARHFGDETMTQAEGERLREAIERSGARAHVESLIAERGAETVRRIREADLPLALTRQLTEVTRACSVRRS